MSGVRVVKGFGAEPLQAAPAARPRPTTSTTGRWRRRGCARAYLPALDLLPAIGLVMVLGVRRPPGARRPPHARRAGRVQRLRVMLIWPLRMTRHDRRPGAAGGGRRRSASHEVLVDRSRDRRPRRRAAAADARAARRGALRGRARSATRPGATGARRPRPRAPRRASRSRWSAPTGMRQVHRRPAGPALLRRRRGPRPARRRRRARRCDVRDLRRAVGHRLRGDVPVHRHHRAATSRSPTPTRPTPRSSGPRALAGRRRVHRRAARRLRHRDRRARLLALGRAAPAHRHRPGDPRRPPRADPRRRHVVGRPDQGARDPRRARRGDARAHDDRHRPPARHDRAGRPGGAARRRPHRRRRAPTRACSTTSDALPRGAGRRPRRRGDGRRRRERRRGRSDDALGWGPPITVEEDERLDARGRPRGSCAARPPCCGPYRAPGRRSATVRDGARPLRALLAGPAARALRHRPRHPRGDDGAL